MAAKPALPLLRRCLSSAAAEGSTIKPFANLNELEALAKPLLTPEAYGYYVSGAEGEYTLRDNEAALARWRLLPRVLVDVQRVDTSITLLGRKLASPVLVAPMAMQRLAHPDGELAVTRASTRAGTVNILSTMSTCSLGEVAEAAAGAGGGGGLWFQLYVMKRREYTEAMIKQAEELGYTALVVTVDAPRLGKRDRDEKNRFALPPELSLRNLEDLMQQEGGSFSGGSEEGSQFGRHFSNLFDRNLTWPFITWLKSATTLPVLVKGVLAPDDARRAVDLGVDGIIISNHGGRQLDHSPAPIDLLPAMTAAVQGRVPLLVDGGIRRGSDVVKCLALGASAVCLGRPVLWALALGGEAGVAQALEMLRLEVELSMALLGCRTVEEITPDFAIPPLEGTLQLPKSRL